MWSSIVGALLGKVAPKVADYYIKKQELRQEVELEVLRGKAEYERAKTQRASWFFAMKNPTVDRYTGSVSTASSGLKSSVSMKASPHSTLTIFIRTWTSEV